MWRRTVVSGKSETGIRGGHMRSDIAWMTAYQELLEADLLVFWQGLLKHRHRSKYLHCTDRWQAFPGRTIQFQQNLRELCFNVEVQHGHESRKNISSEGMQLIMRDIAGMHFQSWSSILYKISIISHNHCQLVEVAQFRTFHERQYICFLENLKYQKHLNALLRLVHFHIWLLNSICLENHDWAWISWTHASLDCSDSLHCCVPELSLDSWLLMKNHRQSHNSHTQTELRVKVGLSSHELVLLLLDSNP